MLDPTHLKKTVGNGVERWLARNRSLVLRQTPVWAQSTAVIVISLASIAVVGSILFKIDEVVTVQGQLESVTGSVEVKTPAGGQVHQVHFQDGQLVKKGAKLITFDTSRAADTKSTLTKLIDLESQRLASTLQTLQSKTLVIQKKLATSREITQQLGFLVKSGGFQRVQYLRQLDNLYQLEAELANIKLEIKNAEINSQKTIDQLENELRQAELQLKYQVVIAPEDGIVFDPKVRPRGVFGAGETLLTIVPQQGLQARIYVPNKDIGFVKTGQKAQVRVDAFPFTRYGELKGLVAQIGADALPPDDTSSVYRFPIKLTLDKSFLQTKDNIIPLMSGMSITANLKLREKRVISLVSDLLVDQTESIKSIRQQ